MQMKSIKFSRSLIVGIALAAVGFSAMASGTGGGTGGQSEFGALFNTIFGWTTGFLGKALALFAFVIGAGMGIARSTLMPAIIGIVFALVLSLGPNIIVSMFSSVV
jgi:conjugal transfer pilus assembly protein TraA